jgi:signal transduction histidine kinase
MKGERAEDQPNSPLKKLFDAFANKKAGQPGKETESIPSHQVKENEFKGGFSLQEQLDNKAWLTFLIRRLKDQSGRKTPQSTAQQALPPEKVEQETVNRLLLLYGEFEDLAHSFNRKIDRDQLLQTLHMTSARFLNERETKGQSLQGEENSDDYHRCRVTSANQSVSFKAGKGSIEVFMQPADLLFLAKDGETRANLKMSLSLKYENERFIWLNDGLPSSDEEQLLTVRRLFYELTSKGLSESKKIVRSSTTMFNQNNEDKTLAALVLDKQNLVNKLVNRHEELTTAIARDLHDSVVADVMHLKRKIVGEGTTNSNELVEILDRLNKSLREICYDLAPRDLEDWGLPTVIEDLVERVSKETTAHCRFVSAAEPPKMERAVQLQIYRIVQESLNNAAKYSQATNITVSFVSRKNGIDVKIEDDGIGFSEDSTRRREILEGGAGLTGIRERTEMIRCFHPTRLQITSEPGQGTRIELSISVQS